jgi:hypothetical protein
LSGCYADEDQKAQKSVLHVLNLSQEPVYEAVATLTVHGGPLPSPCWMSRRSKRSDAFSLTHVMTMRH